MAAQGWLKPLSGRGAVCVCAASGHRVSRTGQSPTCQSRRRRRRTQRSQSPCPVAQSLPARPEQGTRARGGQGWGTRGNFGRGVWGRAAGRLSRRCGTHREHPARDAAAEDGIPSIGATARLLDEALGTREDGADDRQVFSPRATAGAHLLKATPDLLAHRQVVELLRLQRLAEWHEDRAERHAQHPAGGSADDAGHGAALPRGLTRLRRRLQRHPAVREH